MLLSGDELGPHPARQQQRLVPGHRAVAGSTGTSTTASGELLTFTRRLIALRRAHPVFRRDRFLDGAEGQVLPDSRWFRADGRRMTQANWHNSEERVVGLFLNGAEMVERDPHGRPIVDDSFLVIVNGHYEDVEFTLPTARWGRQWCVELSTADPHAAAGSWTVAARSTVHADQPLGARPPSHQPDRAVSRANGARPALRATYRLQLHAGFGFREALAVVPYLRDLGISHLYLSPSMTARPGSTHGYDVVDPNRISDELGGEDAFRDLCAAGLGVVLDIVPNHLAVGDGNPWWADESVRAKVFDWDPATGWYRRFFDIDDLGGVRQEDPEVFALTHRKVAELLADKVIDGLRVDHIDGLADPAGYLDRLAGLGADRVLGREDPPHRRGAATLDRSPARPATSSSSTPPRSTSTPPARRRSPPSTRSSTGETRAFAEVAAEAERELADGTFARDVERLATQADDLSDLPADVVRRVVADAVASPSRVPDVRAAGHRGGRRRRPGGDRRRRRAGVAGRGAAARPAGARRARHPLPADHAAGDRQGRRGHRLLPLQPPARAQRGRRRSGPVRALRRRLPRRQPRSARPGRRRRCSPPPPTTRSAPSTPASRLAVLSSTAGTAEGGTSLLDAYAEHVRRWFDLTEPLVVDGVPGPNERWYLFQTLVATWPIEPERLRTHLEKAFREAKVHTTWIDPDAAWERQVQAFARTVVDLPALADELRSVPRPGPPRGRAGIARPDPAADDVAGRPRHLPG